jgi:imidazolonepropionase
MKMSLPEVISAWTVGASYALSLEKEVGSLTVGKSADCVVLDGSWRDLFYRVGASQIQQVYYKGQKTLK